MRKMIALLFLVSMLAWTGTTLASEWDTIKKEIDMFLQSVDEWETGEELEPEQQTPTETPQEEPQGESVENTDGETVRTVYGTEWVLAGIENGEFQFSNNNGTGRYIWNEGESYDSVTIGAAASSVSEAWGEPESSVRRGRTNVRFPAEHYDIYERNDKEVTVFYDRHEGDVVKSIYIVPISTATEMGSYYADAENWINGDQARIMFGLINKDRTSRGLEPLTWREELVPVAQAHSEDMKNRDYFSHTNPDGEGPAERAREAGVSFRMIGENLAYGQNNAVYAHEGLMDSKGHRENILNSAYEEVGIGIAVDEKGAPYFTILFYTG